VTIWQRYWKIPNGSCKLSTISSIPSLINDIASLNIVRIGEKPIQFIVTLSEDLPLYLMGDDLRVKQVFNNLLSNAFKYTHSGYVEWVVSHERDGEDVWLVSEVRDTGIGIRSEDIPALFRIYGQVDTLANRETEGTGLGLPITERLVDMMDGSISIESEYGKGSTFSVRLRQQFVADATIGRTVANSLMSGCFTFTKRVQRANLVRMDLSYAHVLVVDDMPTNLDVARGMLMPYGLRVDCASSGLQAIEMIRAENPRYDAVFMDHRMPGMDGMEAVRIIREEIGTDYARKVPVIALTANAIVGTDRTFLEHGFQAFISKPIDIMRLDSALRQWVRNKDRERSHDMESTARVSARQTSAAEQGSLSLDGLAIDGVDVDAGLERFAGRKSAYLKILQSYSVHTRPLLEDIAAYLASENLQDYAVKIHGIKGASFGIGASDAGTKAAHLEQLAKAGDAAQTAAENSDFITYMECLLNSIDSALEAYALKEQVS
jgi:CheY-like chemotaxis protein/HPt (histidine-containing phosphotransfer) domain-containing protein